MSTAPCGKGTRTREAWEHHKEHECRDLMLDCTLQTPSSVRAHFQVEPVTCRVAERFVEFGYLFERILRLRSRHDALPMPTSLITLAFMISDIRHEKVKR